MAVTDRVAIVTGAGRGIGRWTAHRLAADGCRVALVGPDLDELSRVREELTSTGVDALVVRGDLADPDSIREFVAEVHDRLGHIDVLVNNAARFDHQLPAVDYTREQWDDIVDVNVTGTFLCTRDVARLMRADGVAGRIVNVGAIQVWHPLPGWVAYVASKGAIEAMTRALAVELAPDGILVNAVAPGGVDVRADEVGEGRDATLLGRLGHPREVADLIAYLASERNTFVVGEVVRCDGGRVLVPRGDHQQPPS